MITDKEVQAVKYALNRDWPEETTADQVARAAIKALDNVRGTAARPLNTPLRVGQAFRGVLSSKTHYVAWIGLGGFDPRPLAWVVSADDNYGWVSYADGPFWNFASLVEEKETRRRTRGEDGEWLKGEDGKDVWTVYPKPGDKLLGSNEVGLVVGDRLTFRQDMQMTVEAVTLNSALLRSRHSGLVWVDENSELKKHYFDGWRN